MNRSLPLLFAVIVCAAPMAGAAVGISNGSRNINTYQFWNCYTAPPCGDGGRFAPYKGTGGCSTGYYNWNTVTLYNDYISVEVMPDFGGHILRFTNNTTGHNQFFENPSGFKGYGQGWLGWWIASGGIEIMSPISEHVGPWYPAWSYSTTNYGTGVKIDMSFSEVGYNGGGPWSYNVTVDVPDGKAYFKTTYTITNQSGSGKWLEFWNNRMLAPGQGNIAANGPTNRQQHFVLPRTVTSCYNHNDNGGGGDPFGGPWQSFNWPQDDGYNVDRLPYWYSNGWGYTGWFTKYNQAVTFAGVYNYGTGSGENQGYATVFPQQIVPGIQTGVKFWHWGSYSPNASNEFDGGSDTYIELMTGPVRVFEEDSDGDRCDYDTHPVSGETDRIWVNPGSANAITYTEYHIAPIWIGDMVHAEEKIVFNFSAPSSGTCGSPLPLTVGAYPTSPQGTANARISVEIGGVEIWSTSANGRGPANPYYGTPSPTVSTAVPGGAQQITLKFTFDDLTTATYSQSITMSGPCQPTATPTNTPPPAETATPTNTPAGGCPVTECFETLPAWSSQHDADWGGAASWSIAAGMFGNSLRAERSNNGSSAKVLWFPVVQNHTYRIDVYMKTDEVYSNCFWMETGYRLGQQTAADYNDNSAAWTLVKKFDGDCGGYANGQTSWAQYSSSSFSAGANTWISIGVKLGRSDGGSVAGNWDHLHLVDLTAPDTATPTNTPVPSTATPTNTSPPGAPTLVTVDGSVPGNGYDQFPTIGAGVGAVASGGRVVVRDGTYNEYVTLNKSLTLMGEGSVILDGAGTGMGLSVTSTGVTIAYLRIQNYQIGIDIGAAGIAAIHHCNFVNNALYALRNNNLGQTISAENCWWGSSSGP